MVEQLLEHGIQQLALDMRPDVQRRLVQYLRLLGKWNRAYNLTAVRDPKQMVTRHIMDSLSIVEYIGTGSVLDVGSGAGLPGIPLALCLPEVRFTLLDSNGKKTRFMLQAVQELGLKNVVVVKQRVDEFMPEEKFQVIVSRAYSTVANLVKEAAHLVRDEGRILAMKGTYPVAELDELGVAQELVEVVRLHVPGVNAERHLVIVKADKVLSCSC